LLPLLGLLAVGLIEILMQSLTLRGLAVFKVLGIFVGLYTLYAALKGEVYAKSGASGKVVTRAESPGYFWVIIAIYASLSVALVTVF
jgi:hypothetical protein